MEVLVEWKDMPREEATWEKLVVLKETFPNYNLEDKVVLYRGILIQMMKKSLLGK